MTHPTTDGYPLDSRVEVKESWQEGEVRQGFPGVGVGA